MQDFRFSNSTYNIRLSTGYDEGLRKSFLKIYLLMSTALVITSISAFSVLSFKIYGSKERKLII